MIASFAIFSNAYIPVVNLPHQSAEYKLWFSSHSLSDRCIHLMVATSHIPRYITKFFVPLLPPACLTNSRLPNTRLSVYRSVVTPQLSDTFCPNPLLYDYLLVADPFPVLWPTYCRTLTDLGLTTFYLFIYILCCASSVQRLIFLRFIIIIIIMTKSPRRTIPYTLLLFILLFKKSRQPGSLTKNDQFEKIIDDV